MPATPSFLLTSPIHILTFGALIKDKAPDIPVTHLVGEDFLSEARDKGISPELTKRIHNKIIAAIDDSVNVVLYTCSSIGGSAESSNSLTPVPVIRVDRPMAEKPGPVSKPATKTAISTKSPRNCARSPIKAKSSSWRRPRWPVPPPSAPTSRYQF